ncbi:hypothetical protein SAMN05216257_104320 [Meinhardsimonia xiamenensis]|jgi:hypothetical protein|uniref:DUF1150 family protein n=1 Tax=Meinhardsimonia xiamenensis TaxID=990712 RepID=A0A1G9EHK4_9RHOB|nr:DUF1150 family protein [Meinhardsimonia xiamenensis]PRX33763.1 hypothetical protein LV81_02194 [Meinhardsimonia xiamenensis]SDK75629.1 hypothetical protein SAMN05216257_104320 [Meinhardsimonia xiamenensis]
MNEKFEFEKGQESRIVYVRPVKVSDLPAEVRAHAGGLEKLYAVHGADGERLALVRDRNLAFVLARQNDLAPVNVH